MTAPVDRERALKAALREAGRDLGRIRFHAWHKADDTVSLIDKAADRIIAALALPALASEPSGVLTSMEVTDVSDLASTAEPSVEIPSNAYRDGEQTTWTLDHQWIKDNTDMYLKTVVIEASVLHRLACGDCALAAPRKVPSVENPRESVEDCDESIHSEACVKRMYAQAGVAPPSPRKVALPLGHEFMTAPKSTNLANFGMCGYITRFLGPPRHRPEYCGKPEAAHAPTPKQEGR